MLRVVVVLCAVAALVQGQSTPVSRCSVHAGDLPLYTYIEGCTQTPCPVVRGTDTVINMVFRAPRFIRTMTTYATAHILFTIPHDLEEHAETCKYLSNTYCPVLQDEIVQYELRMPMGDYPQIVVTIELRIEDENGVSFICIRLPVRVVAGTAKMALDGPTPSNGTVVVDIKKTPVMDTFNTNL